MSTPKESNYINYTIPQLVKALCDHGQVGSQTHSEISGALQAALTERISSSIDNHEKAASKLSRQVFWLNIVLGIFTVVGTILAVVAFIKQAS